MRVAEENVHQYTEYERLWNHHVFYHHPTDIPILVKKLRKDAKLPYKKRPHDMGWDISCVSDVDWEGEEFTLLPGKSHLFSTGLSIAVPDHFGFILRDRSGLGIHPISHTAGVIEGTYRGEWKICLVNLGDKPYTFNVGDRICQAILMPVFPAKCFEVEELPETDRGNKGFGSSGK